jgi:hypothetical protein
MNKEALRIASENLQVVMVYLHSTETKLHNNFDPLISNQKLNGQFRINTKKIELKNVINESGENQQFIRFNVEAIMRYVMPPISKEVQDNEDLLSKQLASSIKAIFVAEYRVVNDLEIPKEALAEFGKFNVPYNVWPYWREYCQSTCSRMSLPVIVIPLLRMPPDEAKEKPGD